MRRERGDARQAGAVASVLADHLGDPDLLLPHQRQSRADHYTQHILHVDPDGEFSILALVWLPGQRTPLHDHICWCVVGVYEGVESEHRYRMVDGKPAFDGVCTNVAGSVSVCLPPGDIHMVLNGGEVPAISLHVYHADISRYGSSIRRCYDGG
ncbi:cysteine dioxygenase family protein [Streptomyces sp. NPDC012751]|uniref:cysteine dioxygenase family protein n=1 Tax=unclassified Streptomyces TaxID=2593676 RepID=UPI000B0D5C1F|nr:cysteine dioxygenase family protein [Streptomyces sp. NRRL S-31]